MPVESRAEGNKGISHPTPPRLMDANGGLVPGSPVSLLFSPPVVQPVRWAPPFTKKPLGFPQGLGPIRVARRAWGAGAKTGPAPPHPPRHKGGSLLIVMLHSIKQQKKAFGSLC